ncbi:phosphonate ABC transporter, permease protein PhnE [Corynebacterium amycolatum]|uniref:phosphonate ABC transporter, permease protein PhnE n=1 Tax=Corynebacterium TaxID=1716 RepID=UPI0008A29A5A|nr:MULTISPECIES: phosphonate ABC transporter, permease protein PhnE [Corynebacterium]OFR92846.1 phosphonate ABC transporter permease [Corynebacterium sp. HMSC064E10]QQU98358.1 phosphonate ABC transporter, permease protein PhnE [Corynebacterium amycolatum]
MTAPAVSQPRASAAENKPHNYNSIAATAVLILLAAVGAWSVNSIGINLVTISESADNAASFVARMFPLEFPPMAELLSLIGETLAIVFLATALSVILSVPLAVIAARTTTFSPTARWISRALIVLARAIPDLVLAIVFIRMFGIGAIGGILAMGIHSVGMVAKLYADAIEELDDGPREAIESVGGSRTQQIVSAIPQALTPQLIATALHRFDINLRTSVLLGYVGVGGIGMAIADSLRTLNYRGGMALALVVLLLCILMELLSGSLRALIMRKSHSSLLAGTWVDRMWGTKVRDKRKTAKQTAAATSEAKLSINPPWSAARVSRVLTAIALVVITIAAFAETEISASNFFSGLANLPSTMALFLPPSSGGIAGEIFHLLLDTLQIAFAATFLGAIVAIPIGIMAASNVVANKWVHGFFRVLIVIIRGIPELILAIIFVVISGLGPVAGTLALALGAVGLLSKLVADSLEETDTDVQEALRTTGATESQIFFAATVRQAIPSFIAHCLYLLDTNIRSATLLGVVGAGGIGFQLLNASRVNQFDVVTYILILMVAVVLVVEALSMWLRAAVR